MNLLAGNGMMYALIGISIAFALIVFAFVIGVVVHAVAKRKRIMDERISRVHEILYTEILHSGFVPGGHPGRMTVNAAMTKFLVVYKSGDREIVDVADDSDLCKIYLGFVKKKEEN